MMIYPEVWFIVFMLFLILLWKAREKKLTRAQLDEKLSLAWKECDRKIVLLLKKYEKVRRECEDNLK